MSMIQEISAESDFLYVRTAGEFSLPEAQKNFIGILDAIAQHKVAKVLFDGRQVTGEPQMMERFFYGEFAARWVARYAARGVSRATRFAYVLQEPVLDPGRFGETVATNRGMHLKAFDALEDACQWLQIAPAKHLDASADK